MRESVLAALTLLLVACGADVERVVVYEGRASAAACIKQCVSMDIGDCPAEPQLFYENCYKNCESEAAMQPAECIAEFHAMWDCRDAEHIVICSTAGEPVADYDGHCVEESRAYADCAAERISATP